MATKRLKGLGVSKFGQVELNQVAFRRDGRVEAQCEWGETDAKCENGMLVAVDKASKKIKFAAASETLPIALVYSAEHMYDERHINLSDYYLGVDGGDFLPRVGYLSIGDTFMTDCIEYDSAAFADDDAVLTAVKACGTTALYGKVGTAGAIVLTTEASGAILKVVNVEDVRGGFTMPDGTIGVKFQVIA